VELGAASCDHLEQVNERTFGRWENRNGGDTLPGCDFHLGLKQYAPARKLIEAGAIVDWRRLQSGDESDGEHADDIVAGLFAVCG